MTSCEAMKNSAGERGTAVHKAVQYRMEKGTFAGLAEPIRVLSEPYHASIEKYLTDHKLVTILVEYKVINERDEYEGQFDWLGRIDDGGVSLVDWKTSSKIQPEAELQLSAYEHGFYETVGAPPVGGIADWRVVRFKKDGKYQQKVYKDQKRMATALEAFLGLRAAYKHLYEEKKDVE